MHTWIEFILIDLAVFMLEAWTRTDGCFSHLPQLLYPKNEAQNFITQHWKNQTVFINQNKMQRRNKEKAEPLYGFIAEWTKQLKATA